MKSRLFCRLLSVAALLFAILEGRGLAFQETEGVPAPLRATIGQLLTGDAAERAAVYESLAKTRSGAVVPVLDAYRNGLLERRTTGDLVIYLAREEISGRRVFPLVDAWTLAPLLDSSRAPVYADGLGPGMLKADPADAGRLADLISLLSLDHPDPSRRMNAVIDAANRIDVKLLPDLRTRLRNEAGGELEVILRESIARIELASATGEAQLSAVRTLGDLGTSRAMADLRGKLDNARQNDGKLAAEIDLALAKVERYQWRIRIVQHTFAGLSLGSILVLLALGLSIIFGLMRVINLAHGEFMMVGAYTTYVFTELLKTNVPAAMYDYLFIVAFPLAFLVAGLVGWICEATVIKHLYGRPIETLLATWGISLLLIQTARLMFGDTTSLTPPGWLQGGWAVAPDLVFPLNRVFIILFCTFCVAIVYYLVHRTHFGLLLRATTQDRPIAAALGVPTRWIDGLTFGFGAGLAGLAGAVVPLFDKLNPNMGQGYVVDSFMVVVVGGVGKLAGAITAGSALGFITKYLEPFLEAVYGKLAVLGLIILFLQWRPSGLFPHRGRLAED